MRFNLLSEWKGNGSRLAVRAIKQKTPCIDRSEKGGSGDKINKQPGKE